MNLQDILNIFLIIGLITFIICISVSTYFFVKAFKAVVNLADNIQERVKIRALAAIIPAVLLTLVNKLRKKGR